MSSGEARLKNLAEAFLLLLITVSSVFMTVLKYATPDFSAARLKSMLSREFNTCSALFNGTDWNSLLPEKYFLDILSASIGLTRTSFMMAGLFSKALKSSLSAAGAFVSFRILSNSAFNALSVIGLPISRKALS